MEKTKNIVITALVLGFFGTIGGLGYLCINLYNNNLELKNELNRIKSKEIIKQEYKVEPKIMQERIETLEYQLKNLGEAYDIAMDNLVSKDKMFKDYQEREEGLLTLVGFYLILPTKQQITHITG